MAQYTFFPAASRGETRRSWCLSRHTFSFGNWYQPDRMGFGLLQALNVVSLAPGSGFDTRPADNMEIILLPLEGVLNHRSSLGNSETIAAGEALLLSTGTGIFHAEANANAHQSLVFLQIWILPVKRNFPPCIQKITRDFRNAEGKFIPIAGTSTDNDALLQMRQNARLCLGRFQPETEAKLPACHSDCGLFLFVLQGEAEIAGHSLAAGDGLGITHADAEKILITSFSVLMLIQVPMIKNPPVFSRKKNKSRKKEFSIPVFSPV